MSSDTPTHDEPAEAIAATADEAAATADEAADEAAPIGTRPVEHPDLGPATAILDDRQRTKRDVWAALLSISVGLMGVYFGVTDAQKGDGTAFFWIFIGLIVLAYGVALLRSVVVRFLQPVRLVLAESGFDYPGRPGATAIRWDELSAADLDIPAKQTRPVGVCFQVRAPETFAERHAMSGRATRQLIAGDGWISVRGETAMPLEDVAGLMQERIQAAKPPRLEAASTAKRRARRTSRH